MHPLLVVGAVCVAVGAIGGVLAWTWRALRFLFRLDAALPVLMEVADQFRPNGGKSLHDRLERLELGQRALLMDMGYATLDDLLGGGNGGTGAGDEVERRALERIERDTRSRRARGTGSR